MGSSIYTELIRYRFESALILRLYGVNDRKSIKIYYQTHCQESTFLSVNFSSFLWFLMSVPCVFSSFHVNNLINLNQKSYTFSPRTSSLPPRFQFLRTCFLVPKYCQKIRKFIYVTQHSYKIYLSYLFAIFM